MSNSRVLDAIRMYYPDYHPLVSIAHIAHTVPNDPRLQFDCHKTIAQYVEPALKSLEVKGTINETRRVSVSLFEPLLIEGERVDAEMVDRVTDVY